MTHAECDTEWAMSHSVWGGSGKIFWCYWPVNESVTGDREQLSTVFIMKGSGTVRKLHTSWKSTQTCRQKARFNVCPRGSQNNKRMTTRSYNNCGGNVKRDSKSYNQLNFPPKPVSPTVREHEMTKTSQTGPANHNWQKQWWKTKRATGSRSPSCAAETTASTRRCFQQPIRGRMSRKHITVFTPLI